MTALVTGITGMIGQHFAHSLRARGYDVYGLARSSASSRQEGIPDSRIFRCDILDRGALQKAFQIKPDLVAHFAAQAFNGVSWEAEDSTQRANYLGTAHVLQCCRDLAPRAKVLLACSSAEYGAVAIDECPIKEDRLLRPISPYGVSKVATECLGYQYYSNYGLQVFLPRLFIHVGTGHPPATAIQNFARQLALIACGKTGPLMQVGTLETARDFIDVRDGVEGMILLLESGKSGLPVNVCTGMAFTIEEVLKMLIEISGVQVDVQSDSRLFRPSDEPLLLGDNSRLRSVGWIQKFTIRQTLEAVYEDWLRRVA